MPELTEEQKDALDRLAREAERMDFVPLEVA